MTRFESIEPMNQVASQGIKAIEPTAQVLFPWHNSIQLITQAKTYDPESTMIQFSVVLMFGIVFLCLYPNDIYEA